MARGSRAPILTLGLLAAMCTGACLLLAESALRIDDHDALAHLALFCNLARRLQTTGPSLLRPFEMLQALQALDRAVALAPTDPDVLTAKGALLVQLPRLLGGDVERGEQWLRRALAVDPHHPTAQSYLADTLSRRRIDDRATQ